MGKHREVTIDRDERLRRAAHIFAAAAVRAALKGHVSVADEEGDHENHLTGRRADGAAANPAPRSTDACAVEGGWFQSQN